MNFTSTLTIILNKCPQIRQNGQPVEHRGGPENRSLVGEVFAVKEVSSVNTFHSRTRKIVLRIFRFHFKHGSKSAFKYKRAIPK